MRGAPGLFRHEEVSAQVPDLNLEHYFKRKPLHAFAALPDPRVFKVHAPADSRLRRVIYLVRDPRDTLLSYYYYLKWVEPGFSKPLDAFVLSHTPWPMDWDAYVGPWLELAARSKYLVLRYEDLHADPRLYCRKALDYAGLAATDAELDAAIAEAWRENKRRRTQLYENLASRFGAGVRDIRENGVGAYRSEFSAELDRRCCEKYRGLMEQLGYLQART